MAEKRFLEFREIEGRTIKGTALTYGDIAVANFGPERFEPKAFGDVSKLDVIANLHHERTKPIGRSGGGGLELRDTGTALEVSLTVPSTRDGDDALELVDKKILRGFSVEFTSRRESRQSGIRVIQSAILSGVGLVDRPAYPKSLAPRSQQDFFEGPSFPFRVEIRQRLRGRAVITGFIEYDKEVVTSARNKRSQLVRPGAFTKSLESGMDVYLLGGLSYSEPLAGTAEGSLVLRDTPTRLEFEAASLPRTESTRALLENGRKFEQSARPGMLRLEGGAEETLSKLYDDFVLETITEAGLCEIGLFTRKNDASAVKYPGRKSGGRRRR